MNELLVLAKSVFGEESPQMKWFSSVNTQAEVKSPGDFVGYVNRNGDEVVAEVLSTTPEKVFELYRLCEERRVD